MGFGAAAVMAGASFALHSGSSSGTLCYTLRISRLLTTPSAAWLGLVRMSACVCLCLTCVVVDVRAWRERTASATEYIRLCAPISVVCTLRDATR
eukprot:scaffold27839_cov65-Phaeocystis_antarctica.AAC.7